MEKKHNICVHHIVEGYEEVPSRIEDHVLAKMLLCSFSYFSEAVQLCIKLLFPFKNRSSLSLT